MRPTDARTAVLEAPIPAGPGQTATAVAYGHGPGGIVVWLVRRSDGRYGIVWPDIGADRGRLSGTWGSLADLLPLWCDLTTGE